MASRKPITYADAGVNISESDRATASIKRLVRQTFNERVLAGVGSFGAMYDIARLGMRKPILVSSADGVGTKLKVAVAMNVHDTVGRDLVNHCVNDIAVQGARPLFFLDYFSVGTLDAKVAAEVVRGLSRACRENGCALIGGETAEMPGLYQPGDYDLAGFIVGLAEGSQLLGPTRVRENDLLLGLASNGLHTNGYSLARRLLFEVAGLKPEERAPSLKRSVGRELLRVHRSYLKPLQALGERRLIHAAAHITGGGITENVPRMLPKGLVARVRRGSWPVQPIFCYLRELGALDDAESYRTFNMGLGLIAAVPARARRRVEAVLGDLGETAYWVGEVTKGRRRVIYE